MEYEKKINPNWNAIQNIKFSSLPKYSEMAEILKHYGIKGWEMEHVGKKKKYISISFEYNDDIYFFKGSEIENIIKQFPFTEN